MFGGPQKSRTTYGSRGFQGHPYNGSSVGMSAMDSLDLENINTGDIVKIHKTQSSVPQSTSQTES